MKKIFSAIAVVLFAAITLASCASSDVDKVVGILNDATEKVNALEVGDYEGLQAINDEILTGLEQYKESTQELNEGDYKALATAMFNLSSASYEKFFGAPGSTDEQRAEAVDQISKEMSTQYKTLGDFVSAL